MLAELTSEQRLIYETACELGVRLLAPRAASLDREGRFPREELRVLADAGLLGIIVPAEYGGAGADLLAYVLATQALARACASTSHILTTHVAVTNIVRLGGSAAQKRSLLPPLARGEWLASFAVTEPNSGASVADIETTARPEGENYVLNGTKSFASYTGYGDTTLLLARAPAVDGYSLFLVDNGTPGLQFGRRFQMMGLRASNGREVILDACRVPANRCLAPDGGAMQIFARHRVTSMLSAAATSLGIAEAALEASIGHARSRLIAGRPIARHQAVQMLVAEMFAMTRAARALLYEGVRVAMRGEAEAGTLAFTIKQHVASTAVKVAERAMEVHGGHGFDTEMPIERYYRDARGLSLHHQTDETLKILVGSTLLGQA